MKSFKRQVDKRQTRDGPGKLETLTQPPQRITNVEPWPRGVVEKAYQRMDRDWDRIEEAAIRAQGRPGFND